MKPTDYVLPGWTFVSMFIIVVTVPPSRADTVTIIAVADAEIRESNSDGNFGAGATVVSGEVWDLLLAMKLVVHC